MRFTLWGITQYRPDMFDSIVLPESIDKTILLDTLMQYCGTLYPYHQHPDYLKQNITNWFIRKKDSFQKIINAIEAEYSPIENYDRTEQHTETPNIRRTKEGGHKNVEEDKNRKQKVTTSTDSTESVSADNITTFVDTNKNSVSTGGEHILSGTTENVFTYQNESEHESGSRVTESRVHGNIGVTTNQQMIFSEIDLRTTFDIYTEICVQFEREFLMQVY